MSIRPIYESKEHKSYFSTARTDVVPLVPAESARVLELGCGEGATLAYLKREGLAEWTCGIDIHEQALQVARSLGVDKTVQGNIEELQCLDELGAFDVILCLDVLEHLVDPWTVVGRLSQQLSEGGVLIASIPNVQHIRVIAPLIIGRWTYEDCGLLDNGHLRFFTKKSALELMCSGGLVVDLVMQKREFHWLPRLMNVLTLGFFSRLITVQYLIRVKRPNESSAR